MGLVEGIKTAVREVTCAGSDAAGWVAGLLSEGGLPTDAILEEIQNFQSTTCNRNPNNLTDEVGIPPNFDGLQCPANYSVSVDIVQTSGGTELRRDQTITAGPGPVLSIVPATNGSNPGYTITYSGGVTFSRFAINVGGTATLENITGTRTDGGPDNCGDPEGQPPPPISEHDDTIDVDYDDDNGDPVSLTDLPIKFFPPCIYFDGVRIPFEVSLPWGGKICGKIGFRPDVVNIAEPEIDIDVCPDTKAGYDEANPDLRRFFEVSAPIGPGPSIPQPGFEGPPPTSFDPEQDLPILGVVIASSLDGVSDFPQTPLVDMPGEDYPIPIIPRIGWVRFQAIALTESSSAQGITERIDLGQADTFIGCPFPTGAASVEVHWEFPWTGSYRTLRRKTCCDLCAENDPRDGLPPVDRCRID